MAVLAKIPTEAELADLICKEDVAAAKRIAARIEALYDMDRIWSGGGKKWTYEYKYRRGGKTLCALYFKKGAFGLMMIFGAEERERVEALEAGLAESTRRAYDGAAVYHDGKWVMFDETIPMEDLERLLRVKRRPNRKV